jgi:hypothetical protein
VFVAHLYDPRRMPWYVASFPWLVFLIAAWLVTGAALARGLLRLRDGIEVASLALPLGLVTHLAVANALGRAVFLPFALWSTAWLGLLAGVWWLARYSRGAPLAWDLPVPTRAGLLTLAAALALGVLALNASEHFVDDGGHASMTHLLAAGQFPLRFQCNPGLRASYAYGGDLLAAQSMVVAGLRPFEAVDWVKSLVTAGAAALAFLAGYRPRRLVGSGLLAVALLFTVGPMVWIYLPLAGSGIGGLAVERLGLASLVDAMQRFTASPWSYGVATPGFITTQFGHAQRAMAWGFAPFQILLFLALLEAPLTRARRTLALGLCLATTALLQPAALLLIGPGFVAYAAWMRLARGPYHQPVDAHVIATLALAAALALLQGGPITDSLHDRLEGVFNPTTSFRFDPLQLPSCRGRAVDATCGLLSVANLGLAPFLLPWLARSLWREGPRRRLVLALGCAAAYAFPCFFRYGYDDWNLQRSLTYATWTTGVLLAPLLHARLAAGGARRVGALVLLFVLGWGGLVQLGVVLGNEGVADRLTLEAWRLGPLDAKLAHLAPHLPLEALIFDPEACLIGTATRPGILFGRYGCSSHDRLNFASFTPAFAQLVADPRPELLRSAGYTHVYLDARWLRGLAPEARARLLGGPYEQLGLAGEGDDFRALLRVCAETERCSLRLPPEVLP